MKTQEVAPIVAKADPAAPEEIIVPESTPGDCASELAKYDWPQADAYKIMMKESRNTPTTINDNPNTGDYSIGCFQINLIGNMRNTRPPEDWLKIAENNVAYAYKMYSAQGRSFCKTSGWQNSCIKLGMVTH